MTKRYSNNFSYLAAYTWSHNFDDSTATNFSTILSPRRAQDFQNMRAEWASSALDRRHRFTLTPIYDFKPFQGGSWMLKNIVGNWNISGTYTFQSPEYATVQSGVDSNLNNDTAGDRAIVNPAGAANTGSGVNPINAAGQVVAANSASIVAYVAKNPNARYIQAGAGAFANGGRNTFTARPHQQLRRRPDEADQFHRRQAARFWRAGVQPVQSLAVRGRVHLRRIVFPDQRHQPQFPGAGECHFRPV